MTFLGSPMRSKTRPKKARKKASNKEKKILVAKKANQNKRYCDLPQLYTIYNLYSVCNRNHYFKTSKQKKTHNACVSNPTHIKTKQKQIKTKQNIL